MTHLSWKTVSFGCIFSHSKFPNIKFFYNLWDGQVAGVFQSLKTYIWFECTRKIQRHASLLHSRKPWYWVWKSSFSKARGISTCYSSTFDAQGPISIRLLVLSCMVYSYEGVKCPKTFEIVVMVTLVSRPLWMRNYIVVPKDCWY